jgi:flagellar hook assembly protein FlgD
MREQPQQDYLFQNFPNPFMSSTRIEYALSRECAAEVSVFDVNGRRVRTLLTAAQGPGRHSVIWDGCDESGRRVSPGIYFYRLEVDNHRTVRKMVLAR